MNREDEQVGRVLDDIGKQIHPLELAPESLRMYTKAKLELAEQLRMMSESFSVLRKKDGLKDIAELTVRLAEDRFTLAVLGQFKRGKSSLMNAIIGEEILPTGVLPVTSAITVLRYGAEEKLIVNRERAVFPEEHPVCELSDFVTEKGNPGNQKKIETAILEMPVPFLRRGLEFVDTPGIGSSVTANTKTTLEFLPFCDAVIFVTSVDTPLSEPELDFLKTIREHVTKIFFVVNKIDLVTEDELEEILGFMKETLRTETDMDALRLFPVSARSELASKLSGTQKSGPPGLVLLEKELADFLARSRYITSLHVVARKALQLLNAECSIDNSRGTMVLQEGERKIIGYEKTGSKADDDALAVLEKVRAKLESFYNQDSREELTETKAFQFKRFDTKGRVETEVPVVNNKMMNPDSDLESRECPVCHHLAEYSFDFLSKWQYQIGKDEKIRVSFAKELGFCPLHTWQLLSLCSSRGASIGFANLAEEISDRLLQIQHQQKPTSELEKVDVHHSHNCRLCGNLLNVESAYIKKLADFIQAEGGLNRYQRSEGVCVHHLGKLLSIVSEAETKDFLLKHTSDKFARDAEEMRSFTLKNDALRKSLQNRDEKDAWLRAVSRLVGNHSLSIPEFKNTKI